MHRLFGLGDAVGHVEHWFVAATVRAQAHACPDGRDHRHDEEGLPQQGALLQGQLVFRRTCEDVVEGEQVATELARVGEHRQSVQFHDL